MSDEFRVRVGDDDYVFSDPAEARVAAKRWNRMARELDHGNPSPIVEEKIRELRARAKAAHDWARRREDTIVKTRRADPTSAADHPDASSSSGSKREPAAGRTTPRRQAAAALAQTGVRKTGRGARKTVRGVRKANRRVERAGGAPISGVGEFFVFFIGSLITLVLIEDAISQRGSAGFGKAITAGTTIAHKVIAPVPIVSAGGGTA